MSDDKVKILFIMVNNPGVSYYRFYQFAQRLSELNLAHCRMFPEWDTDKFQGPFWEDNLDNYLPMLDDMVNWADFVVIQYISTAQGLCLVEAIRDKKPCFCEVDDYLSQVPYYSISYDDNKPGERQDVWATRQIIESKGVVTTTNYLKKHFSQWNSNIYVIPNCIDFEAWDKLKSHSNEKVRIGWIGGDTHYGDLKLIQNVLYEVLEKYENTEVYIVMGNPPAWKPHPRLKMLSKWVRIDEYPRHFKDLSFDIGLAPLRDNFFNRGKSNLRYLEYSACKIPTVASNVEPYRQDFQGFLAENDDQWFNQISQLVESLDYRLASGWKAYYDVKDKFDINVGTSKYIQMIREQVCPVTHVENAARL